MMVMTNKKKGGLNFNENKFYYKLLVDEIIGGYK